MFTGGAIFLVLSLLRILIIRLPETPKYFVSNGQDAEVVDLLQKLAKKYNRPCSLTLQQLEACGPISQGQGEKNSSTMARIGRIGPALVRHLKGLFATRKMSISTVLIWFSWACIGLAYPLFFLYLP